MARLSTTNRPADDRPYPFIDLGAGQATGPAFRLGALASPPFAAMWGAQFVSNVGSWMQTVGAQWLMLSLTTSATYVALIQTAASLPIVLFAVLAGTIGDLFDCHHLPARHRTRCAFPAATALGVLALAKLGRRGFC